MRPIYLATAFPLCSNIAIGAAIATFGGGVDSAYTLQQFGGLPAPTVLSTGGNPGGYLRLTANINDQHNFVPFDLTDPGTHPGITFSFQFRIDNLGSGGADGFSFSFLDSTLYGASGGLGAAPFGVAEDPANTGVLGFGFDTWGNGGAFDANELGADYSEISAFSNGSLVQRVDDTRFLPTPFNLKDSVWHNVTGEVDFAAQTISLQVDGNDIFLDVLVPDLVPFENRILFAARTGGANERLGIDNINVLYIPEPSTASALLLGGLMTLRRRRRS